MTVENCNQCPHTAYCPDKETDNKCKPEEKNDKIFHLNCGRGSGKTTKMLEATIKFAEANKGCGAFALITIDEVRRLASFEKKLQEISEQLRNVQNLYVGLEIENNQLRVLKDEYKEIAKERRSIVQAYKDKCTNHEQMLKIAKKFLKGLLSFMSCLALNDDLERVVDFEQISKNISETISKLEGENDD